MYSQSLLLSTQLLNGIYEMSHEKEGEGWLAIELEYVANMYMDLKDILEVYIVLYQPCLVGLSFITLALPKITENLF